MIKWLQTDGFLGLILLRFSLLTDCKRMPWWILGKGLWNEGLIKENFWPVDADLILQIPLSIVNQYDSLVWHFDKNGEYTVKSGYKAAMKYKE